jgi:hypothetical protein
MSSVKFCSLKYGFDACINNRTLRTKFSEADLSKFDKIPFRIAAVVREAKTKPIVLIGLP